MTTPRQQRVIRAAAAATLATFVALLSHVAGGGALPAALGILLPWALSLLVSVVCVGRRLSISRLSVAVIAAQFIFHTLFSLGVVPAAGGAQIAAETGFGPHATHAGHMSLSASIPAASLSSVAGLDVAMLLAHAVAAGVTVFVLHRGEVLLVALRALAHRIGLRFRRHVAPVGVIAVPARVHAATSPAPLRYRRPLVAAPARRGPPVLSVA